MANANWTGNNAKAKGRHAAYGVLMHDDKGERDRHEHANKDIDTTLTHMNFGCGPHAEGEAYEPETYGQKRARLDAILDEHDYKEGSGKNKRVALQGIQIYPPDALLGYDDETGLWSKTDDLDRWFVRADEVARETLGEAGWVSADVHYDEMHWYKEPKTLIDKCSKPHLSEHFVPVVGDPGKGTAKISGKDFSARKRILALNKAIEDMTQNEFGCKWQTKEPRDPQRESKTVEQAKGESAVAIVNERSDDVRRREDTVAEREAEATRLLDGYDRLATEADYLPPHDPANIGERVVAEKRAHDDYWAAYHANGHKPPTVHEPGLRETVKAAKEARAGYEQATEEARRERDGLREFREGLVKLLEDLCWSVKMAQKEEDNKGHKATARFFKTAHGIFVRALTTLDDAHVPEAPTLDRTAWDDALSAAKAEQARAEGRAHATATARVPAPGVPREVRTDWEPRKQSNDRGIER